MTDTLHSTETTVARWPNWLGWPIWGLALLFGAAGVITLALNWQTQVPASWGLPAGPRGDPLAVFDKLYRLLIWGVFSGALGALIIHRQPRNRIGWLLCAYSLVVAFESLVAEYTVYALYTAPGSLPGAMAAAWLNNFLWVPFVGLVLWAALIFPDGKAANVGWRPALWWLGAALALLAALVVFEQPMSSAYNLDNPLVRPEWTGVLGPLYEISLVIFGLSIPVTAISVVVRFRRARGAERQQFKWLAIAAVATGVLAPSGMFAATVTGGEHLGAVITNLSFPLFSLAIGVAVLQYRLYDVDLIINRTLVYGVLTAALVAVYFGSVVILQAALRALSGGAAQSQLAVVGSTLAIAALFNPLRHRVQEFIDRRFYRRKYDAAQTLAGFAAAARDETDLERLSAQLVGVVDDTVQPKHVSLWLRPTTEE